MFQRARKLVNYAKRVFSGSFITRLDLSTLNNYVSAPPSDQAIIAIFEGEWASAIPGYHGGGHATLFDDDRIKWLEKECGGFSGKTILELGPLEGGHTYMIWKSGASSIVSIESNKKAFLKCLLTKELLGYSARFRLGDFTKYLEATADRYDFLLASGVLYHMVEPVRILEHMSRVTDRIGLWTHYFDEKVIFNNPNLKRKFDIAGKRTNWRDRTIVSYRQHYGGTLVWGGFCGGSAPFSEWLRKEDIVGILETLGFAVRVGNETRDHQNGPAILLYAERDKHKDTI